MLRVDASCTFLQPLTQLTDCSTRTTLKTVLCNALPTSAISPVMFQALSNKHVVRHLIDEDAPCAEQKAFLVCLELK